MYSGGRGRRFKSRHPDHRNIIIDIWFLFGLAITILFYSYSNELKLIFIESGLRDTVVSLHSLLISTKTNVARPVIDSNYAALNSY